MKITLRILIIIAITALVAGGVYLLVENTSIASSLTSGHSGERPEAERSGKPEGDETGMGRVELSEGDHDHGESASFTRGLAQMGASLVKIGAITAFILAFQFIFMRLRKKKTLAGP